MTPRRTPPRQLTKAFHQAGLDLYVHGRDAVPDEALRLYDGGPACWLKQHDPLDRPCSGDLEVLHFIGRQQLARVIRPLLVDARLDHDAEVPMLLRPLAFDLDDVADLVELAEWDARNAGPGCTGHHRRFDSHLTPELAVSAAALPSRTIDFIRERGLEVEAERKFPGFVDLLLAGADADHREGTAGNEVPSAAASAAASAIGHIAPHPRQAGTTPPAPSVVGGVGSGESVTRREFVQRLVSEKAPQLINQPDPRRQQ